MNFLLTQELKSYRISKHISSRYGIFMIWPIHPKLSALEPIKLLPKSILEFWKSPAILKIRFAGTGAKSNFYHPPTANRARRSQKFQRFDERNRTQTILPKRNHLKFWLNSRMDLLAPWFAQPFMWMAKSLAKTTAPPFEAIHLEFG